jgi:hypothetical protein
VSEKETLKGVLITALGSDLRNRSPAAICCITALLFFVEMTVLSREFDLIPIILN